MVEQQWDRKPDVCLSECLTEADTFATHKWCESQWVSGLTICRFCPLVVLILKVESFRLKLRWLRPLVRVVVNSVECDYDPLTSFKVNLEIFGANGGILAKSLVQRRKLGAQSSELRCRLVEGNQTPLQCRSRSH